MKEIRFEDYAELGCFMYDNATDGNVVAAVMFQDDAVDLMQWLLEYDGVSTDLVFINSDYPREYYVTLTDELLLSVIPVFTEEDTLLLSEADVMLFDGDTSNKIAIHNDCEQYEIIYHCDDSPCGDCCEDCSCCQKRMAEEAIDTALSLFDYLLNHYDDN
jgi:hypothetical protein